MCVCVCFDQSSLSQYKYSLHVQCSTMVFSTLLVPRLSDTVGIRCIKMLVMCSVCVCGCMCVCVWQHTLYKNTSDPKHKHTGCLPHVSPGLLVLNSSLTEGREGERESQREGKRYIPQSFHSLDSNRWLIFLDQYSFSSLVPLTTTTPFLPSPSFHPFKHCGHLLTKAALQLSLFSLFLSFSRAVKIQ